MNYYNEHDPKAAAWLRELIKDGLIPNGIVDERSITDVTTRDLSGYTQCHFFAGIGGWSLALQLAGWPADRPVWTGSCPCQPFSAAGKGLAQKDERHLWPVFFDLIRQCRPEYVFGEQVASAIGHGWLDGVSADLESEGYACGATVLGAHSVGAPHIRQRLYWVAKSQLQHERPAEPYEEGTGDLAWLCEAGWKRVIHYCECDEDGNCPECGIDFADCDCFGPTQDGIEYEEFNGVLYGRMADSEQQRLEGQSRHGNNRSEPRRLNQDTTRSTAASCAASGMVLSDRDGCGQGSLAAESARHGSSIDAAGRWSDFQLVHCRDGKTRRIPTEPAFFPLANGIPARVVRLRGYGNAIVPECAQAFIEAFKDCLTEP